MKKENIQMNDNDKTVGTVRFPRMSAATLSLVVEYLVHYEKEKMNEIKNHSSRISQAWYRDFAEKRMGKNEETVRYIEMAAHYYAIDPLRQLAEFKMAKENWDPNEIVLDEEEVVPEKEAKWDELIFRSNDGGSFVIKREKASLCKYATDEKKIKNIEGGETVEFLLASFATLNVVVSYLKNCDEEGKIHSHDFVNRMNGDDLLAQHVEMIAIHYRIDPLSKLVRPKCSLRGGIRRNETLTENNVWLGPYHNDNITKEQWVEFYTSEIRKRLQPTKRGKELKKWEA